MRVYEHVCMRVYGRMGVMTIVSRKHTPDKVQAAGTQRGGGAARLRERVPMRVFAACACAPPSTARLGGLSADTHTCTHSPSSETRRPLAARLSSSDRAHAGISSTPLRHCRWCSFTCTSSVASASGWRPL